MNYEAKLKAAMKLGGLSITELAHWLEVPRPSLQGWLVGTTPQRNTCDRIDRKLAQLQRAVSGCAYPFIPDTYTQRQRRNYLVNQKARFRRIELGHDE